MKRNNLDRVIDKANAALSPLGFECIEAEWNQHDELLRLYVDRPEGVDMQACVEATRILQPLVLIDHREPESYQLEVSSPGVERPLRRREHFLPYVGKEIAVHLHSDFNTAASENAAVAGRRKGVGTLLAVETVEGEDFITLSTETGAWRFSLAQVHKANVVYKWAF